MTELIKNQKIKKRKKCFEFKSRSIISDLKIAFEIFSDIKSNIRKKEPLYIYSIITSAVIVLLLISVSFISSLIIPEEVKQFSLHEDLSSQPYLASYISDDYAGMGAGDDSGPLPEILRIQKPMAYIVKKGETVSEIAVKFDISDSTIISFNGIKDVYDLRYGQVIKIPQIDGVPYTIKKGDSLSLVSSQHNVTVNNIRDANNLSSDKLTPGGVLFIPGAKMSEDDYKKALRQLWINPTRGRLTSLFGYRRDPFTGSRRYHYAIDIANPLGTRVNASMSGVVKVTSESSVYGKYIIIRHKNGYQSLYAHLSRVIVRKGQSIGQGQKIGEMGSTGRSTGSHLHFGIYHNNKPINPLGPGFVKW